MSAGSYFVGIFRTPVISIFPLTCLPFLPFLGYIGYFEAIGGNRRLHEGIWRLQGYLEAIGGYRRVFGGYMRVFGGYRGIWVFWYFGI